MKAELHRRAREVFVRAIELEPPDRARFVEAECASDSDLHTEVSSLLAAHARQRGFDSVRASTRSPSPYPPLEVRKIPERIGRYRVLDVLGEGGMGVVYLAEQENPRRRVALKVLHPGIASPSRIQRFEHEAQILGRLHHPGIAQVHEAGTENTASGPQPYLAMELVEGRSIVDHAAAKGLGVRERVELLVQVSRAVQHAHERGVIHRDLKPANILVDERGAPKVLDFGIARATADELDARTMLTGVGEILGTLPYMSPEQLGAGTSEIDARTDVYALGVIGYELLSGRLPIDVSRMGLPEAVRAIHDLDPPALGAVVRSLRGDVETILAKALEKDRERRYGSARELAADLERWLRQEPIVARPASALYQLARFAQRNRVLVGGIAGVILALAAGLVVSSSLYVKAKANEERANSEAIEADRQRNVAQQRADDVLSLSTIQDLKELEDRADALWPADPENVPKYEAWLADARVLIEGQPADPARGLKKRPSLAEHEAKLVEIRRRAKPLSPEQVEADRKSSPSRTEWEKTRAKLLWMRRMLGEEAWPSEAEVEASLAKETLPENANGLDDLAWPLVDTDPAKVVYGREARALALARRAVGAAKESERPMLRNTLAWALFRTGRLEEARGEEERAVAEIEGGKTREYEGYLSNLERTIAAWRGAGARSERSKEAAELASRIASLERAIGERRTFEFEGGEDRWWHAQLSKLVSDLNSFVDESTGGLCSSGTSERHGWGIVKRAEFARTIEERSVEGADAKRRWEEAIAAIERSEKYGGLRMTPQLGLLPIGMDPDSRLWEFAHLASGEPVERGSDGKLVLKESMGLVFVLIPGGTFRMGAQNTDPTGPNYDPQARSDESSPHEVTLSLYFLSKYEMTQGQWERFVGRNPSTYSERNWSTSWSRDGKSWSALHPVEQVSWTECMEVMSRLGLTLPSEAQWENGARGGTETPFWTGSDLESLKDAANLADAYGKSHGADAWASWEKDFDDGNTLHAEMGSYRPNPFGLHDVIGNVWEWCQDGYDTSAYQSGPKVDPVAPWTGGSVRVFRGGGFNLAASDARSAVRGNNAPDYRFNVLGLRPARVVTGSVSTSCPSDSWR